MSATPKKRNAFHFHLFGPASMPARRALALLLGFLLFAQAVVPPAYASSHAPARGGKAAGGRPAPRDAAGGTARPAAFTTAAETFGVVLTALSTAFNGHAGIDYHQQSRSVVVSANRPTGQPNSFELVAADGTHSPFSNVAGFGGELKIATARDDGRGASLGGFRTGELFAGTGLPGQVARVAPDGASVRNPWVTLQGEAGLPGGLHVDRAGVFGGDLVVVTDAGGVWRINSSGAASRVASLNTPLHGVTTVPEDAAKYGPWAGKILAGAKEQGAVVAVDAQGGAVSYPLGVNPEDIQLVPAHENFFGLDTAEGKLWGAPADAFAALIGDILIAQESPGTLTRVRWNGTAFETGQIAQVASWGQTTFAPAGVAEVRGVKQVYDKIAVVRHAPVLNSGRVEGALWQLSAENVTLGGTDVITSDLLVPGRPTVVVGDTHPNFGGTIEGVEDSQPTGYTVGIGGNATLRHLINRTNPIKLSAVPAPPAPAGARDVSLTSEGQSPGDFSTLRNLSLSGKAGAVSVPPGTYGSFSLSGRTALVLGVENATEPAAYNLQSLTLTGGSELRLKGPVVLTVGGDVSLTGSTAGAADGPGRLLLRSAEGSVKVGGGGVLYGVVRAPRGAVEIAGQGRVRGTVMCDRLTVVGGGVLQVTETDVPPPPVNRPPAVDAGADQVVTLPSDTVSLNGAVSDDGRPEGSALSVNWSVASGPGAVSFGNAAGAATTAAFSAPGVYVLKLTASDGMLTAADMMQVEVIPRNLPPAVNAGPDATVKLPNPVNLVGTVSDDALPRGSTVTVNWSATGGPAAVGFADANAAATTATFGAPGTYTLRLAASDTEFTVFDEMVVTVLHSNQPPTADAGPDQTVSLDESLPAPQEFKLRAISTGFNSPIGIDYHPPTGKVIMSVNYSYGGLPYNFETVAADGTHAPFSNIRGLTDELKLATVRDDAGGGVSPGGFRVGELFTGSGAPGVIVRVSPDGSQVQNPWVTLPGETGLMRGSLHVDRTGVFGGDLVVVTTAGGVWRVNSAGRPTRLAQIPTHLEGLSTIPDLPAKYGPWAGKILVGAENEWRFYAVDAQGRVSSYELGISPEDIDIIPARENFFGVAFANNTLMGAPAAAFSGMVGDLLVTQESGPLFRVHWNGTAFEKTQLASVAQWEHVTFAPAGIVEVPPVGTAVTLDGAVTDDAAPGFPLSVSWRKVSGPGAVTFASPGRPVTQAVFDRPGTYVLRLTADDTQFAAGDEVTVVVRPATLGRVYTLNADFDEGSYINVTHSFPDQLQLDDRARNFNFIWVAVSSKGTVVKIDTETGAVLGEYLTSPEGQPRNPSRTTVDHNGNVWATNRDGNSVLRVGLSENGQCVDRNHNGVIDTSQGYGDVRPWTNAGGADTNGGVGTAADECVINYTRVNSSGTRHVSVTTDNDVWVSGTGGQRFDLIDGRTGQIKRSEPSVGYGGYGGLIDKSGVIWSARPLLRWDTSKPLAGPGGVNWQGYGHDSYGLCIDGKGNVWNTSLGGNLIYKFAPDGTHLGTFGHGSYWAQGCVVDKNDDVWVAHSLNDSSVGHLKSNGAFVGNVPVGSGPTGVAVDARGKIWATNHNSWNVSRIDPSRGPVGADGATLVGEVDFTTRNLGGIPYNYSDMTGSTLSGAPGQGTWSAVFDSRVAGAEWGRVGWTARVCGDGLITVSVATGEDGANFGQPVTVSNGDDPDVPNGRYAKVSVRFERAASGESPVLYDLSIGTAGFDLETPANLAPDVNAGPDQTLEGVSKATLRGAACDDALPSNRRLAVSWSKVSGPGAVTFARADSPTTDVTFGAVGTYELKLTASDSEFTRGDTVVVEVLPGNEPPTVNAGPDLSVTHPEAATLGGAVNDDGLPRGSTLLVTWSKVSGPGGVTFADPNAAATTARFGAPGTYVLRLTASDTEFAAHDEVSVTVGGENRAPAVSAGPDRTVTLPNNAALEGTADDDGWPEGGTLAVSWSVVSGPGAVTFDDPNRAATTASFAEPGDYVLRLTASDSLLSAADEVAVTVNPAVPPPVVSINGLPDGAEVTTRVNVTGTVSAGSNWKLEYAPGDGTGAAWTTLASGNTPVAGGLLGVFDPTLLLNGTYTLRLVATDAAAQSTSAAVSLIVSGEQKIGNFSLSFRDLGVPVAGLPIEVTRAYDSRDKRVGDFGVGWTLGIRDVRVEKSGVLGADWEQTRGGSILPSYCLQPRRPRFVTVTFPSGKVYKFQAVTSPRCSVLVPIQTAAVGFAPLPGTHGSLEALGGNEVLVVGDAPGAAELVDFDNAGPYNPTRFRFVAEDGTAFILDQALGVVSLTERNGNTLTIDADGIKHSGGRSVLFARDARGRITRITDPSGNVMTYAYDAAGDLVGFTDRENNTTTFTYDGAHGLLAVKDPRGIRPVRNEFDGAGRLTKHIDAAGKEVTYLHDLDARQEVVTDRFGNLTVFEYNARGDVVRTTDAQGGTVTRTYDGRGNVLSETDALGKTTAYTYDAQDNRLSETDPLGHVTRYTYNDRRQVLTLTDPKGRVTSHAYDANGNLTSLTDPAGKSVTVGYDAKGQQTAVTDPLGGTTLFEYDAAGNNTRKTDPAGAVTTYAYDPNGNRLSESLTRSAGGVTETLTTAYEYDRLGRQVKVIAPDGSTTHTVYNSIGRPAAGVDELGRRTESEYDEAGRLIRTTFPDGRKEESEYDAEGRRTKFVDRAGRATLYRYDSLGRLERTTHPDGTFNATTHDALGRPATVTDERGNVTRYEYDAAGRQVKVTDALGNVSAFTYDAFGNQETATDAKGHTTRFEYDAMNRRTRTLLADGTSLAFGYDDSGRVSSRTDQAGRVTRFEYDARGRLTKVIDAPGHATAYTYDEAGNRLTQTDANDRTTSFGYDRMGRRTRRTLPLGMSETYAYDAAGSLTSRTDFLGRKTTYAYDELGRLLSRTPDATTGEPAVTFTYTPTGRRATMTDATGTTVYAYDARDRLLSKQTPQGTLTYTYDPAGNLLTARSSNANGVSINYAHDNLNRLSAVADQRLAGGTTAYAYDADGNLESVSYPNQSRAVYTYDSLNRLTNLSATRGGATLAGYAYTLGPTGNRVAVAEHGGRTVDYTYDELYRLTGERIGGDAPTAGQIAYTYDPVGNRLGRTSTLAALPSTAYAYDANDRLTSDSHDANGNTTGSNGLAYAYDSENRLTAVGGGAISFAYDGDGNRVAKTAGGVTTRYLVDTNNHTGHAQVVEELVGGSVTRQYTYGHHLISQRQLVGGEWRVSFYGYDGHGSVCYLTGPDGAVTDTYTYDAFGILIAGTGTTPNDYLYAGEQFDAVAGLYYLRARYMDPASGRFRTMDTYEGAEADPASLHKYLYANADPVNNLDPSGNMTLHDTMKTLAVVSIAMSATNIMHSFTRLVQSEPGSPDRAFYMTDIAISGFSIPLAMLGGGMVQGGGVLVMVGQEVRMLGAAVALPVASKTFGLLWVAASKVGQGGFDWELLDLDGRYITGAKTFPGGTGVSRPTFPQQELVHAERKIFDWLRWSGSLKPGRTVVINGPLPPCKIGGRGCHRFMELIAEEFNINIIYTHNTTGQQWFYKGR